MPKGVKARETKITVKSEDELPKVDSLSPELEKRLSNLEGVILQLTSSLENLAEKQGKLPTYEKPEQRLEAMKKAKLGDREATSVQRNVDLRYPGADRSGFRDGDIIKLKPDSPKYRAYCVDDEGKPVKMIYEYQCQTCPEVKPFMKGRSKLKCTCGGTMYKIQTGEHEDGIPAYGVILNFMYRSKKGGNKYKVNFPDFGKAPEGNDALLESEMVLCQKA